jgi:GNAT superfamily N-acetyltransferase
MKSRVEPVLPGVALPPGVTIRGWTESDFIAIQRLSSAEGWPTPQDRPTEAVAAWRKSWPALVATHGEDVVGFLRALTDGAVTTYVCEVLVVPAWRDRGIGRALIEACHHLCPSTRLDLLSGGTADGFYEANGFRRFQGFRKSYR